MQQPAQPAPSSKIESPAQSRRDLLKNSAAALSAATLASLAFPSGVYAQVEGPIKVGLVGCGGRGSGAAINALNGDPSATLHAMGDMFMENLETSLANLQKNEKAKQINVGDRKFAGFDAYKAVIAECDYVILATPPHFRPMHLRAAIEAGKHVFCEKPVAVDVPGVMKVMEVCKLAQEKKLSVISGLCYRYDPAKRELVKRIHDGQIGQIVALQGMFNSGGLWVRPRRPEWSDMEWQLRNWLYFTWLSGDHIVEQHVHTLDKMLWMMKDVPPLKCTANGGRTQRTGQEYGHIYDHFDTIFEWEVEGRPVRAFCQTRQWVNTDTDVSDWAFGTDGVADVMGLRIEGKNKWRRKEAEENMYDVEHAEGIAALRKGEPINNGDYMCKATLMGIMGRMAAYGGKTVYWDRAAAKKDRKAKNPTVMDSKEDLSPPEYKMGPLPMPPVAVPGKTKIV